MAVVPAVGGPTGGGGRSVNSQSRGKRTLDWTDLLGALVVVLGRENGLLPLSAAGWKKSVRTWRNDLSRYLPQRDQTARGSFDGGGGGDGGGFKILLCRTISVSRRRRKREEAERLREKGDYMGGASPTEGARTAMTPPPVTDVLGRKGRSGVQKQEQKGTGRTGGAEYQ